MQKDSKKIMDYNETTPSQKTLYYIWTNNNQLILYSEFSARITNLFTKLEI